MSPQQCTDGSRSFVGCREKITPLLMRSAAMPHFSSKIPGSILQYLRHFSKTLDFACASRTQNQGF